MSRTAKGFALLRTPVEGEEGERAFKVFRPSLIAEIEGQWAASDGEIGRWTVKVRGSGDRASRPRNSNRFDSGTAANRGIVRWRPVAALRSVSVAVAASVRYTMIMPPPSFRSVQEYLRAWASSFGSRRSILRPRQHC